MSAGRPLSLLDIMPAGMSEEDFYVAISGIMSGLVVYFVGKTFMKRDMMSSRIKYIQDRRAQLKGEMTGPRKRKHEKTGSMNLIKSIVSSLKLLQQSQVGKLQHNMITAGYNSKDAIYIFAFFQLVLPFLFLGIGYMLALSDINWSDPLKKGWKLLVPIGSAYFGLKLPGIMVANARNKRYYKIQKGLSDALDLMMICAEAGLSLAASLERVSKELRLAYPELAEELALTAVELGFLPDRKRALTNLADRVQLQEVRGIASVLIQTEKYGTPISQALRVLAAEFRTQRMLRAEQKAARLPALMTVPMIVFILPTLFVVVIAPAAVKLMDTMAK